MCGEWGAGGDIWEIFLPSFFCPFRAEPIAYGGSEERGQIAAMASSLHHSHNTRSKLHP